jgi:DNA polymerase-1
MQTPHETTYLIDGSGYIFRAFYAIQRLSNKDGFPTNALYGFLRMILKTLAEANSSKVAIIFDAGRKTFRNELYPEYKANRSECPPELSEQMPYFRELSRALGLPVLECPGFEADDIIATLTAKLAAEKKPVVIVSGDKDLMQLVTDDVKIWDTMKDSRYGPAQVVEKFGVGPDKVTEILALTGDSSDNVPGVDGVGPKTATQLVQKYGDVENIIANIEALKEDSEIRNRKKIAEDIAANTQRLRLARRLVEVERAVPMEKITDGDHHDLVGLLSKREVNAIHLAELFDKFEFQSLFKEFKEILGRSAQSTVATDYQYETVLAKDFSSWLSEFKSQSEFSFDLETTALNLHDAKIVGISFCWSDKKSFYIPLGHKDAPNQVSWDDFVRATNERFADALVLKSGQNIKYDISILELHGVRVRGVAFDSMVAAYLLNPDGRNFNLTALANDYLRLPVIEYEEVTAGKSDFSEVAIVDATRYACQDAHYAWLLKEQLIEKIEAAGLTKVFSELEVPLIPVLASMERAGVKVDADKLRTMSAEFSAELAKLEVGIFEAAGDAFNINSPKQLADIFFNKLGISTKGVKKTKTGFSTDSSVLEKLAEVHLLPALILKYRGLHKLKSTYTDALAEDINPKTGRVHTRLNQTLTGTGRLSSSDPNLQNIPVQSVEGRRIRSAFIPEKGSFFIAADYSQIELRLLAHLSGDENLIRSFSEGLDIHAATAREIMGLGADEEVSGEIRRIGKTINFGIVYGMGAFRLGRELGIPVSQASNYITSYFNRYPKVKEYFSRLEEQVLSQGEVQTIYGRKRVIGSIDTSGRDQGFAMRAAINAPLQGSAADIIKLAMIKVNNLLQSSYPEATLVLQIHDELLVESADLGADKKKKLIDDIVTAMESVITLKVPLKVDAGSGYDWQEAQL